MRLWCGFFSIPILIFLISCQSGGRHTLQLARVFSDHMVLQERREVPVWGWAQPGANVTVEASWNEEASTIANEKGAWQVRLKTTAPGGPYAIKIRAGSENILLKDVLCGEVWLASGQSLMEWEMYKPFDAKPDIAKSGNDQIRLFKAPHRLSVEPQTDLAGGSWQICNPRSVYDFSACAYYFARELRDSLHEPIGIIQATWGGSDIERWMSCEALAEFAFMKQPLQQAGRYSDSIAAREYKDWYDSCTALDRGDSLWAAADFDDQSWKSIELPGKWEKQGEPDLDGIVWLRRTIELNDSQAGRDWMLQPGAIDDGDETYVNGHKAGATYDYATLRHYSVPAEWLHTGMNTIAMRVLDHWGEGGIDPYADMLAISGADTIRLNGAWRYAVGCDSVPEPPVTLFVNSLPATLYNGMIHPIVPFAIRGVLWWQSQSEFPNHYGKLFRALIADWRRRWDDPLLPFLFVQNPNVGIPTADANDAGRAMVREQQATGLQEKATAMVVTIDLGHPDNIHFVNKTQTAHRLVLQALRTVYQREWIKPTFVVFSSYRKRGSRVRISFKNTGSGLRTTDGGDPTGFALAGADGKFFWAGGKILSSRVIDVQSSRVKDPLYLRYGFADNPKLNLVNEYGYPVAPFNITLR